MQVSRSPLASLLAELRRRRVFRAAAVYAVVAWAVIQAAVNVFPYLRLPDWTVTLVIVLAVLGFPLVLVLEWAFVITHEGLVPEPEVGEPAARRAPRWLAAAGGLALVALLAYGAAARQRAAPTPSDGAGGLAAAPSIAVIPFASLSSDPENEYFAGGVHDQILAQLARVNGLRVISRTSVLAYAETQKNVREIAAELGVGAILEGSVQRSGDRVRITVQLIDARTDHHLWAETYNREIGDIFAVQTDIAERIAGALEAQLTPGARARIQRQATGNLEAYDFYLRAREYHGTRMPAENLLAAAQLYQRAIELDPGFALAYADLSRVHGQLYWNAVDLEPSRIAAAREAAEAALRIDPHLPEAHLAMGYYHYWGYRDYERALAEFEIARRGLPNDAEIEEALGFIYRRQGRWAEAVARLERAVALSPRDVAFRTVLAGTYSALRRYPEALRAWEQAEALAPDAENFALSKAMVFFAWQGTLDSLRVTLDRLAARPQTTTVALHRHNMALLSRRYDEALAAVRDLPADPANAFRSPPLRRAEAYRLLGDTVRARAAADSARIRFETLRREWPGEFRIRITLGLAYAQLGRREDAVGEARRALELLPVSRDAFAGPGVAVEAAAILAMVGEHDLALAELERVMRLPAALTVHHLRLHPRWDPLRPHPRFQRLIGSRQ